MNNDELILINRFGQGLVSFSDMIKYFTNCEVLQKRNYLKELANLIIQNKVNDSDIDLAILLSNLKPSYTPCVIIKKGIKWVNLEAIINLPDYELIKSYSLFLGLFMVGYKRRMKNENDNSFKWWYQDLSDNNYIDRINALSIVDVNVKKIFNNNIEIGIILTAVPSIPLNFVEKDMLEQKIELYVLNNNLLCCNDGGYTIFKQKNTDMASIVVIGDINSIIEDSNFKISIY
jgi:hypothetical protein